MLHRGGGNEPELLDELVRSSAEAVLEVEVLHPAVLEPVGEGDVEGGSLHPVTLDETLHQFVGAGGEVLHAIRERVAAEGEDGGENRRRVIPLHHLLVEAGREEGGDSVVDRLVKQLRLGLHERSDHLGASAICRSF